MALTVAPAAAKSRQLDDADPGSDSGCTGTQRHGSDNGSNSGSNSTKRHGFDGGSNSGANDREMDQCQASPSPRQRIGGRSGQAL